jgi:hypothetical protein
MEALVAEGGPAMLDRGSEWQPISTAPFDCDLERAVINYGGVHGSYFRADAFSPPG